VDAQPTGGAGPWLAVGRELTAVLDLVEPREFESFATACREPARRWFFTGQGRSGLVAQMVAMRFMHLGREAHVLGEATAPSVREGDALIVVSGSGETPVSVAFARIARSEGARVLLVTGARSSTLAGLADSVLVAPVGESGQLLGNLVEQASLILLDAVAIDIAEHDPAARDRMAGRHTNML